MSREPKVIKELIEKIENPTEAAKSTIDTLIRDVRKLDKNESCIYHHLGIYCDQEKRLQNQK